MLLAPFYNGNKFGQNKDIKRLLFFAFNSADEGGAIYLEANSKFRTPRGENCTMSYELEFDKVRTSSRRLLSLSLLFLYLPSRTSRKVCPCINMLLE